MRAPKQVAAAICFTSSPSPTAQLASVTSWAVILVSGLVMMGLPLLSLSPVKACTSGEHNLLFGLMDHKRTAKFNDKYVRHEAYCCLSTTSPRSTPDA